ncbi:MAG: metal ABC transporter ATP-binding protein [Alphaproteobacteria bacterium]|nr:metal ABC transporter ATP-binding protein [Alphaproteobacteria bacterium]
MTETSPLIALENAGVTHQDQWLVRGVGLKVYAGEIVTLIGPNGSGKSTTVKMALGLLKLDEGCAMQHLGLVVGYVPQRLHIDRALPLSVARFMCLTGQVTQNAIREALEITGVAHLNDTAIQQLSGGEFQRALLARALVRKPDLLVLDEPVQGVDFAGEIALYELIASIRDRLGCGILLISHDLHVVMAATDRVVCLNGHICCQGTPQDVAQSAEYSRLFGAHAAATLSLYTHDHDHVHLADGTVRHADGYITDHCHPDDGHHHVG